MQVEALDHVNIRTRDVPAAARFYVEVLGLEARNGPAVFAAEQVQWLFDRSGHAIIHLFGYDCEPGPTGPIHHVALRCSGKSAMLERLKVRGIDHQLHIASPTLTQVFLRDPHGVLLELNFAGD